MNMVQAVSSVFSKYVTFSGRAARSEYWWWTLAYVIITLILGYLDRTLLGSGDMQAAAAAGEVSFSMNLGLLGGIWTLVCLLPGIAVSVRRLHDVDRSGWWLLVSFVPLLGWILLLVWYCRRGNVGDNRFGGDPLG